MATGLDLDGIDWASLGHAYGPADDTPDALRALADPDPEMREEALDVLFGSICHQGTLYSATPRALPFLIRHAADPAKPDRLGPLHLVSAIAESGDAIPDDLAAVREALTRDLGLLLTLLDDPDADTREVVVHVLGHLPPEAADQVLPALRARRDVETSPIVVAGLLAAAGTLAPGAVEAWLTEELAPGRPDAVRAGALWASAAAGLPWTDASTEAFVASWLDGEPLEDGWIWSDRPFEDIVLRLDTPSLAALCRTMLDRGTAEAARSAIDTAYERCVQSRSARAELAPLLAEAVGHSDPGVRLEAARAVRDVREATPLAADALAVHADRTAAAFADAFAATASDDGADADASDKPDTTDQAWLLTTALDVLITLGDPRWREPLVRALDAGTGMNDPLGLLIGTDVPCDDVLLGAVRRRLAAWRAGGGGAADGPLSVDVGRHNEINTLTRLVHHWGPDAAEALPELLPLVPNDRWWTIRAIGAMGPAASAAVPTLVRVRDDEAQSWNRRLHSAEALAAVTGDAAQLSACVSAAAEGDVPFAARTAFRHGLPLDDVLPALRAIAAQLPQAGDQAVLGRRIEASGLLLEAGEAEAAIRVAADAFASRKYPGPALDLAGQVGPAAAVFEKDVRARLGDPHSSFNAARALFRITGEAAPFVDAVRERLARLGAGPWLGASLRELGPDAADLLPELRELACGDGPVSRIGTYWKQVREDEESRAVLQAFLTARDA